MNNTQKLQVATDALKRIAREPGCGCDFPCRCNGEEWERINTRGLRGIADTALAILATPDTEYPAAASVGAPPEPEYLGGDEAFGDQVFGFTSAQMEEWGAQQREAGHHAAWGHVGDAIDRVAKERDDLRAQLRDVQQERDNLKTELSDAGDVTEHYRSQLYAERVDLRAKLDAFGMEWCSETGREKLDEILNPDSQ